MNLTQEQVELAERYANALERIQAAQRAAQPEQADAAAAPPAPESAAPAEVPTTAPRSPAEPAPCTERWTLTPDDIRPGIIAWFDDNTLNTDPHVEKPQAFDNRIKWRASGGRPFVCLEADDEVSTWVALSAQYRDDYLKLNPAFVRPTGTFNRTSYITGNVYEGPHHSFCVACAQTEDPARVKPRPHLTAVGLRAVEAFCEQEQHQPGGGGV